MGVARNAHASSNHNTQHSIPNIPNTQYTQYRVHIKLSQYGLPRWTFQIENFCRRGLICLRHINPPMVVGDSLQRSLETPSNGHWRLPPSVVGDSLHGSLEMRLCLNCDILMILLMYMTALARQTPTGCKDVACRVSLSHFIVAFP